MKHLIKLLLIGAAFLSIALPSRAQQEFSKIDSLITRHMAQQHIPGATALIIRDGKVIYKNAFGYADVATKRKMQTNDIFRIASQSKAITSLAVMQLWENGKFQLDDALSQYIPAFKHPKVLVSFNAKDSGYTTRPATREIIIRDLLIHTSGIAYPAVFSDPTMWAIYQKAGVPSGIGTHISTLKEKMTLLASLPLQHNPGEAWTYGLNTDLLGYLIEIWSGQPLDVYLEQHIFEPLDMKDTYFHLPKEKQARLVSLYEWSNGNLEKVDHPIYEGVNPLFPTLKGSYLSGGAGLSSTMEDYARFLTMLLNKGVYKDKRIISGKTAELMLTNQLSDKVRISPNPAQPDGFQFSLGGFAVQTGSFGWGGAFNTHAWADPQEKLIGLLFTQEYLSPWYSIGEEFKVLTYQALRNYALIIN